MGGLPRYDAAVRRRGRPANETRNWDGRVGLAAYGARASDPVRADRVTRRQLGHRRNGPELGFSELRPAHPTQRADIWRLQQTVVGAALRRVTCVAPRSGSSASAAPRAAAATDVAPPARSRSATPGTRPPAGSRVA